MKRFILVFAMLFILPVNSHAAIKSENIEYKQGDTVLEGYLVYDDATQDKRPGIVVVHNWMGFGAANQRADMLAQLGYVALAVDIYGKGIRPKDTDEAGMQATKYKGDRDLLRARVKAGLDVLKNNALVDTSKIAAIGYCFGGTTVLELARSGADVAGVVSFHGGLSTPHPEDAKNIKGKVLVLHGAEDPFVLPSEVDGFQKEMRDAKTDWQLISYGGAVHGFTDSGAGTDNSKGYAYNEKADKRSWQAMQEFFKEIFHQ